MLKYTYFLLFLYDIDRSTRTRSCSYSSIARDGSYGNYYWQGENVCDFKLFGIHFTIKQFPICGAVYVLGKSTFLYRTRMFFISLSGLLNNLILVWLAVEFPREFMTIPPATVYVFPGIILCLANITLVTYSLSPRHVNMYGGTMPTDGLRMLQLPFLSTREVAEEISTSWLLDGYNLECAGNARQAIDSFTKAIQYNPDYFDCYHRRGNAYRKIKDDRQAIDDYKKAIDLISKRIKLERLNAANYYKVIAIEDLQMAESLCLEHGSASLLKQIREELEKISIK